MRPKHTYSAPPGRDRMADAGVTGSAKRHMPGFSTVRMFWDRDCGTSSGTDQAIRRVA
jgi:hypothetical protein